MNTGPVIEGVFAVNKPSGISSAQVLRDLQEHFNPSDLFAPWLILEKEKRERESHNQRRRRREQKIQVKIGHGGTLDPLATGVLITGVGRGTKSLQDFLTCTKVYETVVLFGTSTDTYDRVGKVLTRAPYEHITKDLVEKALDKFRGKLMQLPPLFSALKMNGKPLYEYAREGKKIPREIERRPTEVLELELLEWMEGGTHSHVAPTDEAGYAEINIANQFWKKEDALPKVTPTETNQSSKDVDTKDRHNKVSSSPDIEKSKEDLESAEHKIFDPLVPEASVEVQTFDNQSLEHQKRKFGEFQDELVKDKPPSKKQQNPPLSSAPSPVMSGALISESPIEAVSDQINNKIYHKDRSGSPPAARIRMTVTSGFYVRSFCHDLGTSVGSVAIMAELERTRQGEYEVGKNVLEYSDLEQGEKCWGPKVRRWLEDWSKKHSNLSSTQTNTLKKESSECIPDSIENIKMSIKQESPSESIVDNSSKDHGKNDESSINPIEEPSLSHKIIKSE
ncbi:tRNA pseudouridine synthase B [Blumeria hordei DH14]|nr:tRNA pseudouridine synthase B [Blumeria hordei DH14]